MNFSAPIAMLGGTFDPIHHGHLRIAEEVADALSLSQVRLIPSGTPPHRAPPRFSAAQRLEMCRLAAAENPRLIVDDREVSKTTPSYTIETLHALRGENPAVSLILILGADAFLGLPKWHRWTELLAFCHIALVARPSVALDTLPDPLAKILQDCQTTDANDIHRTQNGKIIRVEITALDISATNIRLNCAAGKSNHYLVPAPVAEYLRRNFQVSPR